MKKAFWKPCAAALILALALAAAVSSFAAPALTSLQSEGGSDAGALTDVYENERVRLAVGEDARISAFEAGGKSLLRTGDGAGASYGTIAVDGSAYQYGSRCTVAPAFEGKSNYSAQQYGSVLVEQYLTIVENRVGAPSMLEWRYVITNTSARMTDVGCRILLAGGGDRLIAGGDTIRSETELSGADIPRTWRASTAARGSFLTEGACTPDRVQYANWESLWETPWDYELAPEQSIEDAAVAAVWEQQPLAPNASREYVAYYGIGTVKKAVTFAADWDIDLFRIGEGFGASLAGTLRNTGNTALEGAYMRCELPEGLSFVRGNAQLALGTLAAGAEQEGGWSIRANSPDDADKTHTLNIYFGGSNAAESRVQQAVFIPGVPRPQYTLTIAYQYEDGALAAPAHTQAFAEGAAYSIPSPIITNAAPDVDTVSGTMPAENVTVTVTYTRAYALNILYKYDDGSTAATAYTVNLAPGASYNVTSPNLSNCKCSATTVSGTMPAEDTTVTVTYQRQFMLTLRNMYSDGGRLPEEMKIPTYEGDSYSLYPLAREGYRCSTSIVSGTMPSRDLEITISYNKLYKLTIQYLYSADNTTAATTYTNEFIASESYSVSSPAVTDYLPDTATVSGTMPEADTTITVTYARAYKLTVQHVDDSTGSDISPSKVIYLLPGTPYTEYGIEIIDYTTPSPAFYTGFMPTQDVTVTFRYESMLPG